MKKINWLIQIDEKLKKEIKSLCALRGVKLSNAVEGALHDWLKRQKNKQGGV